MINMVDKLNITKKMDSLGRVVIPKILRDKYNLNDGEELEVAIIDGWIALRKVQANEDERVRIAREVLIEKGLVVPKELMEL